MKKLTLHLLILILSFVYTYESVQVLANALGEKSSYAWMECLENGENSTESEESKEQKEKVDFLSQFYSHSQLSLARIGTDKLNSHHTINFSSSDHSLTIYSPPEGRT